MVHHQAVFHPNLSDLGSSKPTQKAESVVKQALFFKDFNCQTNCKSPHRILRKMFLVLRLSWSVIFLSWIIYSSTVVKVFSFGEYSRINRFEFLLVLRYRIWLVVFRCFDKYCKKKFVRSSFTLFFQSRLGLTIDSQSHGVQCQHHSPWHWQSRWLWQT